MLGAAHRTAPPGRGGAGTEGAGRGGRRGWGRGDGAEGRQIRRGGAGERACAERDGAMERFGGGTGTGTGGYEAAAEQLSRQQERHYRLLSELQALVKALPR